MSNYNSLKTLINAYIKRNGNQEITGQILNSVLNAMVQSLGNGYQFKGIAIPGESLGTPDQKVFYLAAQEGDYGDISLDAGEVAVLMFDQDWSKETLNIPSMDVVNALRAMIGQLADLDTDTKNNVVSAINEIFAITQTLGVKVKNISSNGKATQFDGAILFPDPEDEEQKINLGLRLIAIGDLIQALEDKTHLMSATEDQTSFSGDVIINGLIANDKLNEIGDLNELSTEEKTTLVKAINEVLSNPAITRHLFVSWGELVSSYASTITQLMNQYDMIVIKNRGTIITSYHDSSVVMYEYSEGWRIGSLENLTLDSELTFHDMLDYLDEHSSFIASKNDIASVTGDLSALQTEDKTNLVGAINEVKSDTGNLSDLQTRDKTNLVSAINEVNAGKAIPDFARNLVPTGAPSEVEFSSRPTGQGVPGILGAEEVKVVKGKSLVWNQLARFHSMEVAGLSIVATTDRTIIINGTATEEVRIDFFDSRVNQNWVNGHKYGIDSVSLPVYDRAAFGNITTPAIITNSNISTFVPALLVTAGQTFENTKCSAFLTDLTRLFGAGNEPATYEEFLSRKPIVEDEYAYNEGTIVNNSVKAIEVTGRNLCNKVISNGGIDVDGTLYPGSGYACMFAEVVSGQTYSFSNGNGNIVWQRIGKYEGGVVKELKTIALDSATITFTPSFSGTLIVSYRLSAYASFTPIDCMVNLGSTALPYEPYEEHTIDLSWVKNIKDGDGNILFPDGLKGVGNVYDEAGQSRAVKRIGVKVLDGTESWVESGFPCMYTVFNIMRAPRINDYTQWFIPTPPYFFGGGIAGEQSYNKGNKQVSAWTNALGSSFLTIRDDDYTSVDAWKSHLADLYAQGKPLVVVYELATPIEVTYPKQETLAAIEDGGIETAIAPTEVVEHFVSGTIGDVDENPQNNDDGNGWWTFYIASFLGGDISGQYTPEQLSEMITIEGFSYDTSKGVEYEVQRPENGKFYLYIHPADVVWAVDIYSEDLYGASEDDVKAIAIRYKNEEDTEVTLNSAPFKGSVLYGLDVYKTLASLVASQQSEE